jgi:hypothetical protein
VSNLQQQFCGQAQPAPLAPTKMGFAIDTPHGTLWSTVAATPYTFPKFNSKGIAHLIDKEYWRFYHE